MDFWATFLGAAFGVVAGAIMQYLVQIGIERRNRKLLLSDLAKEAQYNLEIANLMLAEVARFRAAAQPGTFATFQWYFRAKDMLGITFNRIVSSGHLYKMFTQREISEIQQLQQFFNSQMEGQFVAGRINQLREENDIAEAHKFATYLENEIRKGIVTLTALTQKGS
jgi:hypothetical protein